MQHKKLNVENLRTPLRHFRNHRTRPNFPCEAKHCQGSLSVHHRDAFFGKRPREKSVYGCDCEIRGLPVSSIGILPYTPPWYRQRRQSSYKDYYSAYQVAAKTQNSKPLRVFGGNNKNGSDGCTVGFCSHGDERRRRKMVRENVQATGVKPRWVGGQRVADGDVALR